MKAKKLKASRTDQGGGERGMEKGPGERWRREEAGEQTHKERGHR